MPGVLALMSDSVLAGFAVIGLAASAFMAFVASVGGRDAVPICKAGASQSEPA